MEHLFNDLDTLEAPVSDESNPSATYAQEIDKNVATSDLEHEKVYPQVVDRIILLTTATCGPCKRYKPTLHAVSQELDFQYQIEEYDPKGGNYYFDRFGIRNVPALLYVRETTTLVDMPEWEKSDEHYEATHVEMLGRLDGPHTHQELVRTIKAWEAVE